MTRLAFTPRERRLYQIENVVHGLGMTPVRWRHEAYAECPPEEAYRVRCCHCGNTYKYNQGLYIRRHHEKHHGLSWKEAWDGWCGSAWREELRRALFTRMEEASCSPP